MNDEEKQREGAEERVGEREHEKKIEIVKSRDRESVKERKQVREI